MKYVPKLLSTTSFAFLYLIVGNNQALSYNNINEKNDKSEVLMIKTNNLLGRKENSFLLAPAQYMETKANNKRFLVEIDKKMKKMRNLINAERKSRGLKKLCFNKKLIRAAKKHNDDMMEQGYFSHTGLDGSTMRSRIEAENYNWNRIAENIAINANVEKAHDALMNSPSHRDNILNPDLRHIGLGIGVTGGNTYVTQVFGASSVESCTKSGSSNGGGGGGGGSCN